MIKQLKKEKKKGINKLLIPILIFLVSFVTSFGSELLSYNSKQDGSVDQGVPGEEMAYTELINELENNNVEKATLSLYSSTFVFYLKDDETPYITSNPGTEDFKEKLLLSGVYVEDSTYSARTDKTDNKPNPYILVSKAASCLLMSWWPNQVLTTVQS